MAYSRPVIIVLAIVGAVLITAANWMGTARFVSQRGASLLNLVGYGCTGLSIALFIVVGFIVH